MYNIYFPFTQREVKFLAQENWAVYELANASQPNYNARDIAAEPTPL